MGMEHRGVTELGPVVPEDSCGHGTLGCNRAGPRSA